MRKTVYERLLNTKPVDKMSKYLDLEDKEELGNAEIIFIDNVSDYMYSFADRRWEIEKDFPNVAPPFSNIFMEFQEPDDRWKHGIWLEFEKVPQRKGWIGYAKYFSLMNNVLLALPMISKIEINSDGKPMGPHQNKIMISSATEEEKTTTELLGAMVLYPALLAICFMHCKNVTRIPHGPHLGSKAKRERHAPRIRYHTLVIEPMKKILREEGQSEKTGLKMALHICRGHFKDFREGKGLFGKFKDIYWWDSQVRGSLSEGIVTKDYQVDAPVV